MSAQALVVTLTALAGAITALLAVSIARKATRSMATARWRRVEPAARQALVSITEGGSPTLDRRLDRAVTELAIDALLTVRGEAGEELARHLRSRGVVDDARRRLRGFGSVRRARAADVLGALRADEARESLIGALADRNPEVRQVAARALARIGGEDAAAALLSALSRSALPAGQVAMGLVVIGAAATGPALSALEDPDPTARLVAVQLLGRQRAIHALPALEAVVAGDGVEEIRAEAAAGLGAIGAPSSVASLLVACEPGVAERVRAAAARALGGIGSPLAVERLREMLGEPGYDVPHAAGAALASLGVEGRVALVAAVAAGGSAAEHAAEALALGDVAGRARRRSAERGALR